MKFMMYTTELKFVRRKGERDYIHIQSLEGCYSYVGRRGGEQPLSLGKGCLYKGTITHELMHAVGFYHEHSRPDRDKYIDLFMKNVEPGFERQFIKIDLPWSRLITSFDYNSVMLYGSTAFSINKSSPTMLKKNGDTLQDVHTKSGMSHSDRIRVDMLYD
ncbi:hypothetical protein HPB50_027216 [Hyalomma asiaticum]|uniref:Uncharacterized protein n=1 Tax=Hyalomma asiaticum TaxID=266040 RepID=A0ACB7SL66_HYAAI|nr:hypothetical protein HPB50_027216 [Hyalomma asiaticum]